MAKGRLKGFTTSALLSKAFKIIAISAGNQAIQEIPQLPATIKTVSNIGSGIALTYEVADLYRKLPMVGGLIGGIITLQVGINQIKLIPDLLKEITSGNFFSTEPKE